MKKEMKKILNFSHTSMLDVKESCVEVYENTETNAYVVAYKYASMEEKEETTFNSRQLAMYYAQCRMMFILS